LAAAVGIRYEGLRELAQSLKETDQQLLGHLRDGLEQVGAVVRDEASRDFVNYSSWSAANFETRVRAGGQSSAVLVVGQRLRKTSGKRPDFGALQVTHAFLPAWEAKADEATDICEHEVVELLHEHGF
jgi:hypothetical protein